MIVRQKIFSQQNPQFEATMAVYHELIKHGHKAVIAGGAVRDWILGKDPQDIDFATDASPDRIGEIFSNTIPVGKAFGVMVVLQNGYSFQVATFRNEGGYFDGRHPGTVSWGTPEGDAQRRDFTINGLFYAPGLCEIWDFVGGMRDLSDKTLRMIGDSQARIQEDHLRILRAYRFKSQLGFQWDPQLQETLQRTVNLLSTISRERVRDELLKLFSGGHRESVVKSLVLDGVLKVLFPQIDWRIECHRKWLDVDPGFTLLELGRWALVSMILSVTPKMASGVAPENPGVGAFSPQKKFEEFKRTLKLSRDQLKLMDLGLFCWQIAGFDPSISDSNSPHPNPISTAEWVERWFDDAYRRGFLMFLVEANSSERADAKDGDIYPGSERICKSLNESKELFSHWGQRPEPWIRAEDLSFLTGVQLGKALKQAYGDQLTRKTRNREEALEWIKKNYS